MIRMNGRILLALTALLTLTACTRSMRAQALPAASGPGSYVSAGLGYSSYQADYGQRVLGGGMVFVDVHPTWRYGVEGEARLLNRNTTEDVTESTYLVGPHIYLLSGRLRPYAKLLVGLGKINLPFNYGQGTYFAYAPGAGVDYIVSDRISLRLIDAEYQEWPQFTFGNLHPYGVSAGVIIRLNRLNRFATR
jgi:opacity protein-like surface antigen